MTNAAGPLWIVVLVVPPEDADAMQAAAVHPLVSPFDCAFVVTEFEGDAEDHVVMAVRVHADTSDAAIHSAEALASRVRQEAGLSPRALRLDSVERAGDLWAEPREFELRFLADRFLKEGRFEFAVIAAQMSCEVYVELAINQLLDRHPGPLGGVLAEVVRSRSFGDDRTCRLFAALTGRDPRHEDGFWPNYKAHLDRRHRITHRGETASQIDAMASIAACGALFEFVADAWTHAV